jgi:hypothetical protein
MRHCVDGPGLAEVARQFNAGGNAVSTDLKTPRMIGAGYPLATRDSHLGAEIMISPVIITKENEYWMKSQIVSCNNKPPNFQMAVQIHDCSPKIS